MEKDPEQLIDMLKDLPKFLCPLSGSVNLDGHI